MQGERTVSCGSKYVIALYIRLSQEDRDISLERSFSEEYRELYCQLHESISDLVWYIRQQSIPNDKNRTKKK